MPVWAGPVSGQEGCFFTSLAPATLTTTPRPIVTRGVDGRPVASSRDVAAYFGKEHHNVLKAIDALIREASSTGVNFNASSYKDSTGRSLRCYLMTRDGFTLLAMGFTGAKALQFKLAYIDAFNAMEAELTARPGGPYRKPSRKSAVSPQHSCGFAEGD